MPAHANRTRDRRRVPLDFDEYLAKVGVQEVEPQECTSCFREGGRWQFGPSSGAYCEPCLRYQHGYDQGEEKATLAILGGAVMAALDANLPAELLERAVAVAAAQARLWDEL
jgi:hypothetical protein